MTERDGFPAAPRRGRKVQAGGGGGLGFGFTFGLDPNSSFNPKLKTFRSYGYN